MNQPVGGKKESMRDNKNEGGKEKEGRRRGRGEGE